MEGIHGVYSHKSQSVADGEANGLSSSLFPPEKIRTIVATREPVKDEDAPHLCRAPTSTGARSRPQPLISRSLSLGLRSVANGRSVHVLKCLLSCLSALDCLACLELLL